MLPPRASQLRQAALEAQAKLDASDSQPQLQPPSTSSPHPIVSAHGQATKPAEAAAAAAQATSPTRATMEPPPVILTLLLLPRSTSTSHSTGAAHLLIAPHTLVRLGLAVCTPLLIHVSPPAAAAHATQTAQTTTRSRSSHRAASVAGIAWVDAGVPPDTIACDALLASHLPWLSTETDLAAAPSRPPPSVASSSSRRSTKSAALRAQLPPPVRCSVESVEVLRASHVPTADVVKLRVCAAGAQSHVDPPAHSLERQEMLAALARRQLLDMGLVQRGQSLVAVLGGQHVQLRIAKASSSTSSSAAPSTRPTSTRHDTVYRVTRSTAVRIAPPSSHRRRASASPRASPSSGAPLDAEADGFGELGGLDAQIAELRALVQLPLARPELFEEFGLKPPRGVLLYGPPGTGKTSLARAAALSCGVGRESIFLVSGPELSSSLHGGTEAKLRRLFALAQSRAPSVVILDEVDALAPRRDAGGGVGGGDAGGGQQEGAGEVERRTVATLLTLMDGVGLGSHRGSGSSSSSSSSSSSFPSDSDEAGEGGAAADRAPRHSTRRKRGRESRGAVVVIAATNRPNAVDPALRRPGRLDREIEVGIPTVDARQAILGVLLRRVPHALSEEEVRHVASVTHGYVGADLAALVREAGMRALRRRATRAGSGGSAISGLEGDMGALSLGPEAGEEGERVVTADDFLASLAVVRPSAMREVHLSTPKVRWSDVAAGRTGLEVQSQVRQCVEWPLRHAATMKRLGVKAPRGLLLYGPPGCSKTLMAQALASESGLNFVAVKGPELYNKYVGESERALRDVFRKARAAAPSIIFFDELDALTTTRSQDGGGGGSSGLSDRVIATLLNEMDGVEALEGVLVLGATNRPEIIDPALLRPGRLDRLVYVGPPDLEAREQLLSLRTRAASLAPDVDLHRIAELTEGCSGAEVVSVTQEAAMLAMAEDVEAPHVAHRHLERAARAVRRRITPEMLRRFEAWRGEGGGGGVVAAAGTGAGFGG